MAHTPKPIRKRLKATRSSGFRWIDLRSSMSQRIYLDPFKIHMANQSHEARGPLEVRVKNGRLVSKGSDH